MGGNLFDSKPIHSKYVQGMADSFLLSTGIDCEHYITGSYRRNAEYCGDIEIVLVGDRVELGTKIGNKFGFNKSCGPKMNGLFGEIQFDLHITERVRLGTMLLHTTGSYKFNILMRNHAKVQGLKLNQYGVYRNGEIACYSEHEEDIFKFLKMKYRTPSERSIA